MLDFGSPNTLKPSAFLYVSAVITLAVRNLADSGAYRGWLVGQSSSVARLGLIAAFSAEPRVSVNPFPKVWQLQCRAGLGFRV